MLFYITSPRLPKQRGFLECSQGSHCGSSGTATHIWGSFHVIFVFAQIWLGTGFVPSTSVPETSVRNSHHSLRNNPLARQLHRPLRGRGLNTRTLANLPIHLFSIQWRVFARNTDQSETSCVRLRCCCCDDVPGIAEDAPACRIKRMTVFAFESNRISTDCTPSRISTAAYCSLNAPRTPRGMPKNDMLASYTKSLFRIVISLILSSSYPRPQWGLVTSCNRYIRERMQTRKWRRQTITLIKSYVNFYVLALVF